VNAGLNKGVPMRYDVHLEWFGDDDEWIDVEAASLDDAAEKVWEEWHQTGWTDASILSGGEWRFLNLEAADFDSALSHA